MAQTRAPKQADVAGLTARVSLEFFGSMKNVAFQQVHQPTLIQLINHHLREVGLNATWRLGTDPTIAPTYPQWFDDVEARPVVLWARYDLQDKKWEDQDSNVKNRSWELDMRRVLETPSEDAAVLYCETNSTTHLTVRIRVDQGRWMHQIEPLEKVKKLAMLVLAFEPEIDKMLADHVGYINEDASARSNANNIVLWGLSPKLKLQKLFSAKSVEDVVDLMCPTDPSISREGWSEYIVNPLNELYKYNFRPIERGNHRYVEFRQHQGTLNANEVIYWIKFVGGLVDLAGSIVDNDLLRLVHMEDMFDVNITELFAAMAIFGSLQTDLEMVQYYTRKIYARGGQTRRRSKMRLGEKRAGARTIRWRDLSPEERVEP